MVDFRVEANHLEKKFSKALLAVNSVREAILTAHPTRFYPGQVLAIVTDLTTAD